MKSASSFLLAARQCEISELEQLAHSAELVGVIGRCVHALQRERGICNIFLSSHGTRFDHQRQQQLAACEAAERDVRAHLDALDTDAQRMRNGSRLFSRVAVALHALDGLPGLRTRIATQAIAPREATAAFVKLVAALLAVVFEAADSATDPQISGALVALFNFMQGKEFAGQERAHGAGVFASGACDAATQQQWRHLVESQQGCLQVFADFADPDILRAQQAGTDAGLLAQLEQLRRIGCSPQAQLDPHLSLEWYGACTRRIDAMRVVEDLQALHLRHLCEQRIAQARAELHDQRALLASLDRPGGSAATTILGPQMERAVLGLLQEQSRRLQAMGDELDAVRASLTERKFVERAKGLLMAHRNMREDEAYKALRQMAMNQNRRLVDVAQAVLALADVLPAGR